MKSIIINKFSFYYFWNYNICRMIIWQLLSNLSHFYLRSAVKTCYFCTITFSFKKGQILIHLYDTYLLTNAINFAKYFMLMCFQVAGTHLTIYLCLESSIFQEKQCYILTSLLILKDFL